MPVTGKIRLGWEDMRTYKLVARIVEENGGSLIAIHGRTKEQSYGGQADWDAIAEVKAAVKIPGHRQRRCEDRRGHRTPEEIHRL